MAGYFELHSPEDLIRKAHRDLSTFNADPNSDDLWNAVVTANHVWDWVRRDTTLSGAARSERPSHKNESDIKLLKDLAEGLKHFRRREATPATSTELVGSAVLGEAVLGEMVLGSSGTPTYFVTQHDGNLVEVREVVLRVLKIWEAYLSNARDG